MGQQGDHLADELGLIAAAVEGRSRGRREGLVAGVTDVASFLVTMNPNVTLTDKAPLG
jgi:hypothetical protein